MDGISQKDYFGNSIQHNKTFLYKLAFTPSARTSALRSVGHNVLYSTRKQNSFFLFDMSGSPDTWNIHTNHKTLRKAQPYEFRSTCRQPNKKFLISSFLSAFFYTQKSLPNRIRHKYFDRIRTLLLQQWDAI